MHLSHTVFLFYIYFLTWKLLKTWECEKNMDIFGKMTFIVMIRGYFCLYLRLSFYFIFIYESEESTK
jgi:hypothetical protein